MMMGKKNSGDNTLNVSSPRLMTWLGIAAIIMLLDQLTKITFERVLAFESTKFVNAYFNLVMVYNKGAAFSFLADQPGWQRYFFAAISIAASLLIIWLLRRHAEQKLFCWSLTLILGGAVGNLIDRLAYGHVIDFIDLHINNWHWPAFNVADSAITVGAILFVLDELRRVKR
jgi:signal peptidase II